ATLREVVALHPSWKHLWLLARTAHEAGETDAARAALDRLLARRADSRDARSLRAQIELTQGDVERAIDDYESLTRDDPSPVQLGNLAVAYLLATRYDDAVATAERIRVLVPDNAFVLLNLADAYDLAGRRADAARTYRDVIARLEGAESVQALTVRAQAWAHLGDAQPAVAAVQQALQRAPTSAQVAYEAALVYTLVGDLTSASVQAERALDEGYGARWFDFPWFAPLRAAHPSRF
ncbi:MAG: tetratricopeptide repeat protein, partial [Acidobacteriota bacterium]